MSKAKEHYGVRLPAYIVTWLRGQHISGSAAITIALTAYYKIKTPEEQRAIDAAKAKTAAARARKPRFADPLAGVTNFPEWFKIMYNAPLSRVNDEHRAEYQAWLDKQVKE